jgi:hypothetical protein
VEFPSATKLSSKIGLTTSLRPNQWISASMGTKTCPNFGRQSLIMEENIWLIVWLFMWKINYLKVLTNCTNVCTNPIVTNINDRLCAVLGSWSSHPKSCCMSGRNSEWKLSMKEDQHHAIDMAPLPWSCQATHFSGFATVYYETWHWNVASYFPDMVACCSNFCLFSLLKGHHFSLVNIHCHSSGTY